MFRSAMGKIWYSGISAQGELEVISAEMRDLQPRSISAAVAHSAPYAHE